MNLYILEDYVAMLNRLEILYKAVPKDLKNLVKDNIVIVLSKIADFVAKSLVTNKPIDLSLLSGTSIIITINLKLEMLIVQFVFGDSDKTYVEVPLQPYRFSEGDL